MNEQWKELKETIIELRDNDGTSTQQEVCKFLVNLMNILEKQIQEPCDVFNNLCNSCTNIGCEFQSGIVRTKCTFYMPPHMESDNCGNYIVTQSTTESEEQTDD